MLHLRSILCFIHANVFVFLFVKTKQLRRTFQKSVCINHLVIIIHPMIVSQIFVIFSINIQERNPFLLSLLSDLVLRKKHIFTIGNECLRAFHITLCRIFRQVLYQYLCQNLTGHLFIRHKFKCRFSNHLCITLYDLCTNSVNGSKFQQIAVFLTKNRCKSVRHVICCCNRIGQRQYVLRRNSLTKHHISQPIYQHRRLPASRNRQHQHRSMNRLDCFELVFV